MMDTTKLVLFLLVGVAIGAAGLYGAAITGYIPMVAVSARDAQAAGLPTAAQAGIAASFEAAFNQQLRTIQAENPGVNIVALSTVREARHRNEVKLVTGLIMFSDGEFNEALTIRVVESLGTQFTDIYFVSDLDAVRAMMSMDEGSMQRLGVYPGETTGTLGKIDSHEYSTFAFSFEEALGAVKFAGVLKQGMEQGLFNPINHEVFVFKSERIMGSDHQFSPFVHKGPISVQGVLVWDKVSQSEDFAKSTALAQAMGNEFSSCLVVPTGMNDALLARTVLNPTKALTLAEAFGIADAEFNYLATALPGAQFFGGGAFDPIGAN